MSVTLISRLALVASLKYNLHCTKRKIWSMLDTSHLAWPMHLHTMELILPYLQDAIKCLQNSSVKFLEVLMHGHYHCLDKTRTHERSTTYSHVKRNLCAQRSIWLLPGTHYYPYSPSFWKICYSKSGWSVTE